MKANTAEKTGGSFRKIEKICDFCGKELEQVSYTHNGQKMYYPAYRECECPQAIAERERKQEIERARLEQEEKQKEIERQQRLAEEEKRKINELFGNSGMSRRAMNCLFRDYEQTPGNEAAFNAFTNYAKNFESVLQEKRNGLFITGDCGVGKSHLAFATANFLIRNGYSVIAMTMIDLLLKLKSSFSGNEHTEEEILQIYGDCDLLIIDDLGKEKSTEWALQMIYSIVDRRYNAYKPIIITTNFNAEELINRLSYSTTALSTAQAIVDRLFEICEYKTIEGKSFRKR